jgi:ABC-2 type transport system permease protein
MNLLLHEVRYGLIGVARNPRARVMTVAFPLILLVILVGISKGGTTTVGGSDVTLRRFFVAGILAMNLLVACYGSLVSIIVNQRETGVFKRRRATPTPAWVIVAGHALTTLIVAVATSAVLLIVARVLYGVGVSATGLAAIALTVVVGGLAFSCLAYAVASVIPNVETAQPAVQLTMLPLYFISGIWFSTDDLPDALRKIAELLPVEPVAHLLHLALLNSRLDGSDLATLGVWAVAGVLVAARRFTWLPRAAAAAA